MRWLVLEGIDGVGKTSQGRALARHLREAAGVPASYSQVFDTGLGSVVRREFLGTADPGPYVEALLLVAARLRYFDELILPRLGDAEGVVLTDRYF